MSAVSLSLTVPGHVAEGMPPVRMAGTEADPLFCLADVCRVLGLANTSRVIDRLDADDVTSGKVIDSMGREQEAAFINESGLYTVLLRSDKPQAKPFRRWVTGEVLPSIRKHGMYPPPPADEDHILRGCREVSRALNLIADTREAQMQLERKQAELSRQVVVVQRTAETALAIAERNLGCFTILGYLKRHGRPVTVGAASRHGRQVSALCRERGIEVGQCADPRWGLVGAYPEEVLDEYFGPIFACEGA